MSETPINDRDAARRLARDGRWEDLRQLLLTSVDTDTGPVNAWCRAHETHGSIEDYLDDVEPARRAAAARTDAAVEAGRPAPALHDEIWFGLVTASLRGRRTAVAPDLLELAVADGLWTVRQAVAHLHRDRRIRPGHGQGLLGLLPHAPVADRPELLALASAAVAGTRDPYQRVYGWVALLPHLVPGDRAAAVAAALDTVLAMDEIGFRNVLPDLAPHLSTDQVRHVLEVAADHHEGIWCKLVAVLAPMLSQEQLRQAMAVAAGIGVPAWQAGILTAFLPHLPAELRAGVVAEALDAAVACPDVDREEALAGVAAYLSTRQLERAAVAAADSPYPYHRARMLALLVPHAPDRWLPQLLATALASNHKPARAHLLAALAPRLPAGPRRGVLAAADALADPSARAAVLTALLPHAPDGAGTTVIDRAVAAATAVNGRHQRTAALLALVPHLPPDRLHRCLDAVLADLAADPDAADLARLAPHLADRHWPAALAVAAADRHKRERLLLSFVPHLPPDQVEPALAVAAGGPPGSGAVSVRVALARRLPAERRGALLRRILADTAVVVGDDAARVRVLVALVPHLRTDRLGDVLRAATAFGDAHHRAQVLVALVPHLPAATAPALDAAVAVEHPGPRTGLLARLAPSLPPDLLRRATGAVLGVAHGRLRAEALGALLPYLPAEDRAAVLATAVESLAAIRVMNDHAAALAGLVRYLPADLLHELYTRAAAPVPFVRSLATLAPHLPDGHRQSAVAVALAAATAGDRGYALPGELPALLPLLSADQLERAVAATLDLDVSSVEALTALLPYLSGDRRADVLAHALAATASIVDLPYRLDALTVLLPHLPVDERDTLVGEALATVLVAAADHRQACMLVTLGPVLSPGRLDRAMAVAVALPGEHDRTWAMAGLAPHLPPALVARYAPEASDDVTMAAMARQAAACVAADPAQTPLALAVLRHALAAPDRATALAGLAGLAGFVGTVTGAGVGPCLDAVLQTAAWWR
ncbi:hypothetical protein ACQEVZ_09665 [Dactylosporangium sp. CA-152071]|uniref:hypothetical protein n=1 Tax=Dactylosporangium sp. CA-152071 TaxID=3239933 RepID=UPI003D8A166D